MMNSLEKLVYMANQIARNFATQPPEEAVAATADHIIHFWDPRMRAMILDHLDKGGSGLSDAARQAVARLRPQTPQPGK